ncbi:MAG TPA: amidohydrolase family protein [Pyrinomonadaceae bacterium]|nr:amidohydrolase family protein [Pyrinomonadaceae bacterium]
MRNPVLGLAAAAALAAALLWLAAPPRAGAQRPSEGVGVYAITGARVVTVGGRVIERGTVVVRDGLIAAVGAGVAAPPDARVIDGAGLTVYPGLIDASTSLGIPRPSPSPTPAGGGGGFPGLFGQTQATAAAPNSSQPPGLQPEVSAADLIRPGGAEVEAARNAGITAAQTAPRGNVFLGQSALVNLAGDTPQAMILRSPVALYVGLTPLGGGQYPGSLMGVFSSVRQMLLDARRYREAVEAYERNPRGARRPAQDRSLAALQPVLARQMPVVFQADREREINRALDLAEEFNLSVVINGGAEAHRVADRLKAMNVPVLLSLNFPRRAAAASPEADPEPLRVLRERAEAARAAGRLAAAGVRFAFQSGGMTQMSDFLANAARAVEAGLPREAAVRAMTLGAAEILGVSQQLGSVEVGKIANLTVTRGDLFARDRRVAHVFIDGRPVELRPAATAAAGAAPNVSGTWTLNINLSGGAASAQTDFTVTLILQQQAEGLTGSLQGPLGSGQITAGTVSGGNINFTVSVTLPGPASQTTDAIFEGTVTGNEMRGSVQIVGRGPGTFTGTRAGGPAPASPQPTRQPAAPPGQTPPPPPDDPSRPPAAADTPAASDTPAAGNRPAAAGVAGTYSVEFAAGPRTIPVTLTFRQQGSALLGTLQSEFGTSDLVGGKVEGNSFSFTTTVNIGQPTEVTINGTVSGDGISGTAATPSGAATFTGRRIP